MNAPGSLYRSVDASKRAPAITRTPGHYRQHSPWSGRSRQCLVVLRRRSPTQVSTSNSSISPTSIGQSPTSPPGKPRKVHEATNETMARHHFATRLFRRCHPRIEPQFQRRHPEHSRFLLPRMALRAGGHPQLRSSGARYAGSSGPKAGARVVQDLARQRRLGITAHGADHGWDLRWQQVSGEVGQLPAR